MVAAYHPQQSYEKTKAMLTPPKRYRVYLETYALCSRNEYHLQNSLVLSLDVLAIILCLPLWHMLLCIQGEANDDDGLTIGSSSFMPEDPLFFGYFGPDGAGLWPGAGDAAMRTVVPVVRESDGLTITLSDSVTPLRISDCT